MSSATSRERGAHLSQITTAWSVLFAAHQGSPSTVTAAQEQLLQRYSPAVYRYLLAAVRDPEVAEELSQEFALRVVRGAFRTADPGRGRFRSLIKTTLCNLVIDHHRKQKRQMISLPETVEPVSASSEEMVAEEKVFAEIWRNELMARAWDHLAACDHQTGQHLYTVLRYRVDHPEVRSPQIAEQLSGTVGKPVTAEWIRKRLSLAREKFADLLVEQVAQTLENPSPEELEEELIELELFQHCRSALERWAKR